MALITATNLNLPITAKSPTSSLSVTGVAVPQEFRVKAKQFSYGNTTVTNGYITKNYTTTALTTITSSGTSSEVTTISLASIVPYNKAVTIATIRVVPDSNFKVAKKPSIKITSNDKGVKLILQETTTANLFNIVCETDKGLLIGFEANITYLGAPTFTSSNAINAILFGSSTVSREGQSKNIRIYGNPNTPFKLFILDKDDNSLISNTATGVTPAGVKSCISSSLNSKGYYSISKSFPSIPTIRKTAINGSDAASGATTIIFDSLIDVLVDDQIFILGTDSKPINNGDTVKVTAINVDANPNKCTLSDSITAPDNTVATFKRASSYKINLSTTGTLGSGIPTTFPTYTLNQYLNPLLTITATTTVSGTQINGASALAVDSQSHTGRPNKTPKRFGASNIIRLKYELTGRTFTVISGHPVTSDWSTTSGDTSYSVIGIRTTGGGTSTCTVFAELLIKKWGTSDTVVNLDLDKVIS